MTSVALTLACGNYDRVWPLRDGRVRPEGIDLNVLTLEPEECFWRMLHDAEFDAAEMSLASYAIARAHGDDRFVGVPVFLSRSFRHSTLYLPPGSSVTEPEALRGKRIGVPEYQMTAAVWVRGLLADEYGIGAEDVVWRTGGLEQAGRPERQRLDLPAGITVDPVSDTLSAALLAGEIDALAAPRVPSVFRDPANGVRRLWPDYAEREADYHRRTGIFPIMHMLVLRADVHRAHPWIAVSLYKAFEQAKKLALHGLADAPALRYTMPFLLDALERQEELFGPDPWPYGLAANRPTLDTFAGYLRQQGLVDTPFDPAELFAPSTRELSRI
jgi:4,5-dihydroxyphthalate decarboxylase